MPSSRWVLNGHSTAALGTSVGDEFGSLDTQGGLGAGVEVGYRVTPGSWPMPGSTSPSRAIDEAGLDGDFGLTHIEAGARLSFPITGSKLMPYVGGWVGRRSLTTTVDDFETGDQLGPLAVRPRGGRIGGVQFFVSPKSRAGRRGQPRHREDGEREGGRPQGGLGDAGQHHHHAAQVRGELVSLTRVSSRAQRGILPHSKVPRFARGDIRAGPDGISSPAHPPFPS